MAGTDTEERGAGVAMAEVLVLVAGLVLNTPSSAMDWDTDLDMAWAGPCYTDSAAMGAWVMAIGVMEAGATAGMATVDMAIQAL